MSKKEVYIKHCNYHLVEEGVEPPIKVEITLDREDSDNSIIKLYNPAGGVVVMSYRMFCTLTEIVDNNI